MGVLKREISLGAVFFIIPRLLHLQCGRSSAFDDLVNGQISAIVNCRSAYIQTKNHTVYRNTTTFFLYFFLYFSKKNFDNNKNLVLKSAVILNAIFRFSTF